MKCRICFSLLVLLMAVHCAYGQQWRGFHSVPDSSFRAYPVTDFPVLSAGADRLLRFLPPVVDNSSNPYFPEIAYQEFATCQQFCSVYYDFAYEMNRIRGVPANTPSTTYPAHYTYNFMSYDGWNGVSFFYSLDVLKKQGNPDCAHYGANQEQGNHYWMTGYDNYLNAMQNRLAEVYRIPVNSLEGHITLKNWLFDHLEGDSCGGVAIFSASSPYNYKPVPQGTPEAGKHVLISWPSPAVHGMTITGYNDSVCYDLNGDGLYTNTVDVNGDGIIDLKDWEIGAYKFANSYGDTWGDEGYCYVLYSAMAQDYGNGGIWDQSVYVLKPYREYQPKLTIKALLTYNKRGRIFLSAGVSAGLNARAPEHVLRFPVFNFQGYDHFMQGDDSGDEYKTIEVGLDISPLLGYVPSGNEATWFFMVDEKDEDHTGMGAINSFSIISYTDSILEVACPQQNIEILDNSRTALSVSGAIAYDAVKILTESLPALILGEAYAAPLQATGGTPPYTWSVSQEYVRSGSQSHFSPGGSQLIIPHSMVIPVTSLKLPFTFRFFGHSFDSVYINQFGFISFKPLQYPYPYAVEPKLMLSTLPCISAGYNSEMEDASVHQCWYSDKGQFVEFHWQFTDSYASYNVRIESAIRLYPDGTFEIIFGDLSSVPYFPLSWGVSDGTRQATGLETLDNLASMSGKAFRFSCNGDMPDVSMDTAGILRILGFTPGNIYALKVSVADQFGVHDHANFYVSDGVLMQETPVLGPDTKISFREEGFFNLIIQNPAADTLTDIQVVLRMDPAVVQIKDSLITIEELLPGQQLSINQSLKFMLPGFIPDNTGIPYELVLTCSKGQWVRRGLIQTASPDISLTGMLVDDGSNHMLDPGETADLLVWFGNKGSVDANELSITLKSSDPLLTIMQPDNILLPVVRASGSASAGFRVKLSREAVPEQPVLMSVFITNHQGLDLRLSLSLTAGRKQVTIINLSRNPNSADSLSKHLAGLGVTFKVLDSVPNSNDLASVPAVFLLVGFYASYHILTPEEGLQLKKYLDAGGNMYMEGYSTWRFNTPTALHPMFSYSTAASSQYRFDTISAQGDGYFPAMKFAYKGNPPFAIFKIIPEGEAKQLFVSGSSQSQVIQWYYSGNSYKAIGSMAEFGSLLPVKGNTGGRDLLLSYLKYFNVNTTGLSPLFHALERNCCITEPVQFSDDSFDHIPNWYWEFPGGEPSFSTEQNPQVIYKTPGSYDVKLSVSNGTDSCSLLRQKYVDVADCHLVPEDEQGTKLHIWPNPARDFFFIDMQPFSGQEVLVDIYDLTGIKIKSMAYARAPEGKMAIDLPKGANGVCLVKVTSKEFTHVAKLVIY